MKPDEPRRHAFVPAGELAALAVLPEHVDPGRVERVVRYLPPTFEPSLWARVPVEWLREPPAPARRRRAYV